MNEKQYHKLDKIILNHNELEEISEWVRSQNFNTVDTPLNECFVIINGIHNPLLKMNFDMGLHFKISDDNIFISQYDMSDMFKMVTANIGDKFFTDGIIDIEVGNDRFKKFGSDYLNKLAKVSILMIFDAKRENSVKKYERHTESWSVRGHWRYYKKSGKRVWIDGYVKGKGNIEGKVYKI